MYLQLLQYSKVGQNDARLEEGMAIESPHPWCRPIDGYILVGPQRFQLRASPGWWTHHYPFHRPELGRDGAHPPTVTYAAGGLRVHSTTPSELYYLVVRRARWTYSTHSLDPIGNRRLSPLRSSFSRPGAVLSMAPVRMDSGCVICSHPRDGDLGANLSSSCAWNKDGSSV